MAKAQRNNSKRGSKVAQQEGTTAPATGVIGQAPVDLTAAQQAAQPAAPPAGSWQANPLAMQQAGLVRTPALREYGAARVADLAHSPRKWAVLACIGACGNGATSSAVVLAGGGLITPTHARHYAYHASAGGLVALGGGGAGLLGGGGRGYTFSLTTAGVDYLLAHATEPHVAQIATYAPQVVAWVQGQQQQRAAAQAAAQTVAAQPPAPTADVKGKRGRNR